VLTVLTACWLQVHQQLHSSSDTTVQCPLTAVAPAPPAATLPTSHGPSSAPARDSSSAATWPGSPSAGGSGGHTPANGDAMVSSLRELCPADDVSQEFLAHVLEHHGQGSVQVRRAPWSCRAGAAYVIFCEFYIR
jgi:hypothetical protein